MPEDRFLGQGFNFGTETPVSVLDLVCEILRLMNKSRLTPGILNEANHEIPNQHLSCAKAREMLDWQPRYSQEEGLRETIDWYRNHLSDHELAPGQVSQAEHG